MRKKMVTKKTRKLRRRSDMMQFLQFVAGCKNMAITLHDLAVRFEILQQEVKDIRSLVELLTPKEEKQ